MHQNMHNSQKEGKAKTKADKPITSRRKSLGDVNNSRTPTSDQKKLEKKKPEQPKKGRKRSAATMEGTDCAKCNTEFSTKENHVKCGACREKICRICTDITDDNFWNALRSGKVKGLTWICKRCTDNDELPTLSKIAKSLESMQSKLDDQHQQNETFKVKMDEMDTKIDRNAANLKNEMK